MLLSILEMASSKPCSLLLTKQRWAFIGTDLDMGERRGMYRVWWGNLRERDQWGDPDLCGRIILRWICRKWGMDWIELAQNRDR
jgi:hypothetical protein